MDTSGSRSAILTDRSSRRESGAHVSFVMDAENQDGSDHDGECGHETQQFLSFPDDEA